MQYGICILSVVPGRKLPDNSSEMVTQLLFGEHYSVIEITEEWFKIALSFDGYECWINSKQHQSISAATFNQLQKHKAVYSSELIQVLHNNKTDARFPLSCGSVLPFYTDGKVSFEDYVFSTDGEVKNSSEKGSAQQIISAAYLYLNTPYLWGGKNALGIDCSGFTQIVFRVNGYQLPRDAYQQVELGTPLNFVEEAQAGDLAFFDNEDGKIVHVGILIDNERIIHASGSVRIDRFDHYGIFNTDSKKYSHTLRVIKKII